MIWFTVILLLITELISLIKYRDLKCPAVLHNMPWIVSIIGASRLYDDLKFDSYALTIICIGSVIFQLGFAFSLKTTLKYTKKEFKNAYFVNINIFKIVTVIIILLSLPSIYQYFNYLQNSFGNIFLLYQRLKSAEDMLNLPTYFLYYRKFLIYFSLALLTLYWNLDDITKKKIRSYVILLNTIAITFVISIPTRNSILFYFLPLAILFVSAKELSNKKIILVLFIAFSLFMFFYYAISLGKYWYLYKSSSSAMLTLLNEIKIYLSGSILAFGKTANSHSFMYNGKNTFRFIMAIDDALFGTSSAVKLTNEFISISSFSTNVYTFYDFYIRDYGAFYSLFIQFALSYIHGVTYKGMKKKNIYKMYLFSLLSYPLVMQFFQDQYLSLFSTWIQILLVGAVVLKTNIFVQKIPLYD